MLLAPDRPVFGPKPDLPAPDALTEQPAMRRQLGRRIRLHGYTWSPPRGRSSVGRASAWHAEGHGFEPRRLHSFSELDVVVGPPPRRPERRSQNRPMVKILGACLLLDLQFVHRPIGPGHRLALPETPVDHLLDLHAEQACPLRAHKSHGLDASRAGRPRLTSRTKTDPTALMMAEPRKPPKHEPDPPGDFLSEDLREATTRFLDEVKRQIRQRRETAEEPRLGPPRRRKS